MTPRPMSRRIPLRPQVEQPDVLFGALDGYHPARPTAEIDAPADLLGLLEEIAQHIQVLYDLDRVDAIARMNDFWRDGGLWLEDVEEVLGSKMPEDWAKIVCYGVEPLWCSDEVRPTLAPPSNSAP